MDARDRLLQLIERLYAAPGDLEGWHGFLVDLYTSFHGSGAQFISHDFTSHQASVAVTAGFAPDDVRAYESQWAKLDPWATSTGVRRLSSGSVAPGDQFVTHAEMRRTAFYNDFGRQHDVVRCITGTLEIGPHRVSVLSVNGSEHRGPFGSDETSMLSALMPHLQRALQMHRRLADAQGLADGWTAALDRLAHGILLLDTAGRIMFANRTAEEILRAGDGLSARHKELFGGRVNDTNALRQLIADAVATSGGLGTGAGGLVLIERPSGRAALRVLVTPVSQRAGLTFSAPAAACVFITDPERNPVPAAVHFQRVFGLSAAETRVAAALLDGESLDRLADRLCISRNTARTHLRRLFAKTATARQSDLVRVLLGAHAPLRFD
ncbi:MAG TPA: helix-turn-helix transcriptional regulator [Vicinamibacterales bacterium]|nr:helix-turn-helix transcriptional regulator [Vicinamibacterales bacterium]